MTARMHQLTALIVLTLLAVVQGSLLLAATIGDFAPQSLVGRWSGSFTIGIDNTRQIAFTLHWQDGGYSATLDMPLQGINGVSVESVSLKGNELLLSVPAAQAEFYGTLRWNADRSQITHIEGDWSQVGEHVAVTLYPQSLSTPVVDCI